MDLAYFEWMKEVHSAQWHAHPYSTQLSLANSPSIERKREKSVTLSTQPPQGAVWHERGKERGRGKEEKYYLLSEPWVLVVLRPGARAPIKHE